MLNAKGLAALTEHRQVDWRLIRVENWNGKKLQETYIDDIDLVQSYHKKQNKE